MRIIRWPQNAYAWVFGPQRPRLEFMSTIFVVTLVPAKKMVDSLGGFEIAATEVEMLKWLAK